MSGYFTTLSFARRLAGDPCDGLSKVRSAVFDLASARYLRFSSRLSHGPPVYKLLATCLSRLRPLPARTVLLRFYISNHEFVDRVTCLESGSQPPRLFTTP